METIMTALVVFFSLALVCSLVSHYDETYEEPCDDEHLRRNDIPYPTKTE